MHSPVLYGGDPARCTCRPQCIRVLGKPRFHPTEYPATLPRFRAVYGFVRWLALTMENVIRQEISPRLAKREGEEAPMGGPGLPPVTTAPDSLRLTA